MDLAEASEAASELEFFESDRGAFSGIVLPIVVDEKSRRSPRLSR